MDLNRSHRQGPLSLKASAPGQHDPRGLRGLRSSLHASPAVVMPSDRYRWADIQTHIHAAGQRGEEGEGEGSSGREGVAGRWMLHVQVQVGHEGHRPCVCM